MHGVLAMCDPLQKFLIGDRWAHIGPARVILRPKGSAAAANLVSGDAHRRTLIVFGRTPRMTSEREHDDKHTQRLGSVLKNAFAASSAALRYSGTRLRTASASAAFNRTAL